MKYKLNFLEFFDSVKEGSKEKESIDAEYITSHLREKESEFAQRVGGIHFARTEIHKVLENKPVSTEATNQNTPITIANPVANPPNN